MTTSSTDFAEIRSRHYPASQSGWSLYHRALGPPLYISVLTVCVVAFVLVLEAEPYLPFLQVALPLAAIVALFVARWSAGRAIAAIQILDTEAKVITLWDLAAGKEAPWQTVLDIKDAAGGIGVVIGAATYELKRVNWPAFDDLVAAIRGAIWHPK